MSDLVQKPITTRESREARKTRAAKILRGLRRLYPDADCALHHGSALQLMISTILSAQSTDVTVNKVAGPLFKKYRKAADFANAELAELEEMVHATGFFRQKAKNIKNACVKLVDEHDGKVPDTMDALVELPGVARKTANVILGTWFKKNEGVVVDTHIGRLATRMALTWRSKNHKDAVKIELDLQELIPRKHWTYFGHAMIQHGRQVCPARNPDCTGCTLAKYCPSNGAFV